MTTNKVVSIGIDEYEKTSGHTALKSLIKKIIDFASPIDYKITDFYEKMLCNTIGYCCCDIEIVLYSKSKNSNRILT